MNGTVEGLARKRRSPTIASLKAKVERAQQGNDGPDIGAMSRAEREKVLFGTMRKLDED